MPAPSPHLPDIGGAPLHCRGKRHLRGGHPLPDREADEGRRSQPGDRLRHHRRIGRLPTESAGRSGVDDRANNVMGRELLKFLDEYGLDEIDGLADAIHSRSEAQTRKAIRQLGRTAPTPPRFCFDGYDEDVS